VIRSLLAIGLAILAGLALTVLDTSAGYDDTGITAVGLAIASFVVVLIDGSGRVLRVAMLAVLVGIWIPLVEIASLDSFGPFAALGFAAAGALVAMLVIRGIRGGRADPESPDHTDGA
jgi:hypothetical protein